MERTTLSIDRLGRAALVVTGAFAIAGLAFHHMDLLGDAFWYIASGRYLLEHRALPRVDVFSYASVADNWIVGMPGACVLFALVADRLSLHAMLVLGALVEATALVVLWLSAARTTLARLALLPLALYFVAVDAEDLSVRGQLFGDLAFVLLLGVLARVRDGRRIAPWWIVIFGCLWANLHYSFQLLFVLPLAAAALVLLEPKETRPPWYRFVAVSALGLGGSLLNPYGVRYLAFAVHILFTPIADDFDFYRSPDLHDVGWLFAPALGLALAVARGRYGPARLRFPERAFLLLFVAAACNSRRWITILVAVEMGLLGALLDGVVQRRPATLGSRWVSVGAAMTSVACAVGGALGWAHGRDPLQNVPVAAAVVAREAQRAESRAGQLNSRVIDPLHWGGYLAYAWNGDPKYFHDGRDQILLFGNGVYEDGKALRAGAPQVREILDAYEAGVVLWERGLPLDVILRATPGWRLVHEDPIAVVFVRAAGDAPSSPR